MHLRKTHTLSVMVAGGDSFILQHFKLDKEIKVCTWKYFLWFFFNYIYISNTTLATFRGEMLFSGWNITFSLHLEIWKEINDHFVVILLKTLWKRDVLFRVYIEDLFEWVLFSNNYNHFPISIKKTDFYRVLKDY